MNYSIVQNNFNNSYILNLSLYNSYIGSVSTDNNSELVNISLSQSSIITSDLKISSINYINFVQSTLFGCFLKQSLFSYYNPTNFYCYNLNMIGSSLNFQNSTNVYSIAQTEAIYNTIKYQFNYTFNNSTSGNLSIPNILIPNNGWYIEKVLVDCSNNTIISSGSSSLSMGISNSSITSGFNNINTNNISNSIKVFDISNGGCSGVISNGFDLINLTLTGDNIIS